MRHRPHFIVQKRIRLYFIRFFGLTYRGFRALNSTYVCQVETLLNEHNTYAIWIVLVCALLCSLINEIASTRYNAKTAMTKY